LAARRRLLRTGDGQLLIKLEESAVLVVVCTRITVGPLPKAGQVNVRQKRRFLRLIGSDHDSASLHQAGLCNFWRNYHREPTIHKYSGALQYGFALSLL